MDEILERYSDQQGLTTLIEHEIIVKPGTKPVRQASRRMSPKMEEFAQREVKKMLEEGIIEESKSDWCSRPVIAKKANESFKFCVDYRDLNKHTQPDMYPIKNMNSVLDKLRKARYITKIDLKSAFMQVMVAESSRKYTAFAVSGAGLYQFRRMPFGLNTSPKTFCRLIDMLFGPEYEPYVFGYLDGIIIVSESFLEHLKWVEKVLKR